MNKFTDLTKDHYYFFFGTTRPETQTGQDSLLGVKYFRGTMSVHTVLGFV